MGDVTDRQKLLALDDGPHTCECCGLQVVVEACDVVDGEITCTDCVFTYYPAVYQRRTGET